VVSACQTFLAQLQSQGQPTATLSALPQDLQHLDSVRNTLEAAILQANSFVRVLRDVQSNGQQLLLGGSAAGGVSVAQPQAANADSVLRRSDPAGDAQATIHLQAMQPSEKSPVLQLVGFAQAGMPADGGSEPEAKRAKQHADVAGDGAPQAAAAANMT
jgi:hypothetical protein